MALMLCTAEYWNCISLSVRAHIHHESVAGLMMSRLTKDEVVH